MAETQAFVELRRTAPRLRAPARRNGTLLGRTPLASSTGSVYCVSFAACLISSFGWPSVVSTLGPGNLKTMVFLLAIAATVPLHFHVDATEFANAVYHTACVTGRLVCSRKQYQHFWKEMYHSTAEAHRRLSR